MNAWGIRRTIFVVTVRAESRGGTWGSFVIAIAGRGVVNIAACTIVG